MPDDLYSLWLKVAPGPRPPDHYALLGLPRFCENQEQIEAAAQRQLDELDRHSLHNDIPRRDACHRMMNEVARARVALTNPQKRAAYDLILDPGRKAPIPTPAPAAQLVTTPVADGEAENFPGARASSPAPAVAKQARTGVPPTNDANALRLPAEHQKPAPNFLQSLIAYGMANPALWIVPAACIGAIAIIIFRATHPSPPRPSVAIAIAPSSKPRPATVPSTTAQVSAHPPVASESKSLPPTTSTTPAVIRESPGPATAPATSVASEIPKPPPLTPVSTLKPLPSADLREKSAKLVDQIYGDDIAAAKTQKAKAELARKMFAEVGALGEHDADRFVLLGRCADLAVEALDLDTAMKAIDAAAGEFQIDSLKIKARAMDVFAINVASSQDQHALAKQMDDLIERAIQADRYDVASYVVQLAQTAAQTVNDPVWLKEVNVRLKAVNDHKRN